MTSLAYRSAGSGDPIIFVHGWGLNSGVFKEQLKSLSDEFRVIAVDLPGHGDTPPKEGRNTLAAAAGYLCELVKELSFGRVHLAGWSLGTHVVCHAAMQMGFDTARSLTIIDGTPSFVKKNEDETWALPDTRTKWILRGLEKDFIKELTEFITTSCYTKKEVKPETVEMMNDLFFTDPFPPDKESAIELLKDFIDSDIRPMLGALKLPCLICHGDRDSILPIEVTKIWENSLPNAKTVIFEKSGHAPFLTQPARFNETLRKFLRTV